MKLLYTPTLLLFTFLLSAQYNYGLEVEQQDAKIEGKLNMEYGDRNVFIGNEVGINNTTGRLNCFLGPSAGMGNTTGTGNSFLGWNSGNSNSLGDNNSFFGRNSGSDNTTGSSNCFFGKSSGFSNTKGDANNFIGDQSGGLNTTGSFNVFIGYFSGLYNQGGSNNIAIGNGSGPTQNNMYQSKRLYIDINDSFPKGNDNPLIYGEFDNDLIRINGTFDVTGTATVKDTTTLENILQLKPLDTSMITPSTVCNSGQVIYGDDDQFYVCKAGSWKQIVTN